MRRASTSPCPGGGRRAGRCIRSRWFRARSKRSSARSATASRKVPRSRTTATTSPCSISPKIIRPATPKTLCSSRTAACCVRILRRCRFAPCWRENPRSGSSARAASIATTTTCGTRRCFTRSRASASPKASRWGTSRGRSRRSSPGSSLPTPRCACARATSRSPSRRARSTSPARSARARGAPPAPTRGGWRSSAPAWSIPRVLANCGIDPDRYSGFAFGLGLDRVAMNKYGIPNIRSLFESDERLLRQVRG